VVATLKLVRKSFLDEATQSELVHAVLGRQTLSLAAESTHQDVASKLVARLLIVLSAEKFGFQLAKPSKFASRSSVAKKFASKFLTLFVALYASQ